MATGKALLTFLTILTFLCSVVEGAAPKRLDSLGFAAMKQAGVEPTNATAISLADRDMYVNMAIRQVCTDFDAVKRTSSIVCARGTRSYSADTLFKSLVEASLWRWEDSLVQIAKVINPYVVYDSVQAGKGEAEEGDKPLYAWAWGKTITIHPTPFANDSILYEFASYDRTLTATSDTTWVLEPFRNFIVIRAAILIRQDLRLPYDDLEKTYPNSGGGQ